MIRCHGETKKQKPWEESVRIPFLVRGSGIAAGSEVETVLDSVDIMPTLLGLCGVDIPDTVQGTDASPLLRGQDVPELDGALLACHFPFHQWHASKGGREYRGVRTERYTYCRDLTGPWLLYDNQADPYQLTNLVDQPEMAAVQTELDALLDRKLARVGDEFLPGIEYVKRRGVKLNERGDVPTYADHGPTE
jgi:arylsulfatase A-like enzyme